MSDYLTKDIVVKEPPLPANVSLDSFKHGVDNLLAQRKYFIEKVEPILQEKLDYYTIMGKKSLAKGGAEKLASIWKLIAKFEKDAETIEMLGEVKGMVAFRCDLFQGDQLIGQGRGADTLIRNQNDPNKTIKMAQKRAYVDAVIRTTGLSDIFTQDLEDMTNGNGNGHVPVSAPTAPVTATPKNAKQTQLELIVRLLVALGYDTTTKIKVDNAVKLATSLELKQSNFEEIAERLGVLVEDKKRNKGVVYRPPTQDAPLLDDEGNEIPF